MVVELALEGHDKNEIFLDVLFKKMRKYGINLPYVLVAFVELLISRNQSGSSIHYITSFITNHSSNFLYLNL